MSHFDGHLLRIPRSRNFFLVELERMDNANLERLFLCEDRKKK